ncbi:MAG: MFS transporter [Clostridia bacterium]|nr:MFS transporter [Clostridia bacterium]
MTQKAKPALSPVVTVILFFGLISLLGDLVYEGARGANSQYFSLLGVTAAQVGLVFGIGEFLGYVLRLLAGVWSDKSGRQWVFLFIGYGMLAVVPVMGLTQEWPAIVTLLLMERIGKALRNPAKDTLLSAVAAHPDSKVGVGLAFGIQEALDQIGAFAGPLIFTGVFLIMKASGVAQYQLAYRLLAVPFALLMLFLAFSHRKVKREQLIPAAPASGYHTQHMQKVFWLYTAFTFFATLGLVNFSVIGFHLKAQDVLDDGQITLLYAGAMVVDAGVALLVGRAYDRIKVKTGLPTSGLVILLLIPLVTILLPMLVLGSFVPRIVLGLMAFGIILGLHETIMRSAIADLTPFHKRGTSYGVFNASYGLALLAGAALMGWLYDRNWTSGIVGLTLASEIIALLIFFKLMQASRRTLGSTEMR